MRTDISNHGVVGYYGAMATGLQRRKRLSRRPTGKRYATSEFKIYNLSFQVERMISKGHEVWPWPSSNSPLDGYRVQELKQMRMVSFYLISSSDEKISDNGGTVAIVSGLGPHKPKDKSMTQTMTWKVRLKRVPRQHQVFFFSKLQSQQPLPRYGRWQRRNWRWRFV